MPFGASEFYAIGLWIRSLVFPWPKVQKWPAHSECPCWRLQNDCGPWDLPGEYFEMEKSQPQLEFNNSKEKQKKHSFPKPSSAVHGSSSFWFKSPSSGDLHTFPHRKRNQREVSYAGCWGCRAGQVGSDVPSRSRAQVCAGKAFGWFLNTLFFFSGLMYYKCFSRSERILLISTRSLSFFCSF